MMRFETNDAHRPRNYLARREQYRLLALVAGVGAVVLLIEQLSRDSSPPAADSAAGAEQRAELPAKDAAEMVVDRERLTSIRDNSHFRTEETDAWFYLFSLAKEHGRALNSVPADELTYTQLVAQPQSYRGQLIRVRGTVKRIEAIAPAENDLGIDTLYRVILKPAGRSPWPMTVYCLQLPAGWSPGEPPSNQVEVAGFFFKNHSYAWQDGMALSPVIVAQTFTVSEMRTPPAAAKVSSNPVWKIVASAAAIAVAIVAWIMWRTAAPTTPIGASNATPIHDALRQLSREEV